MSDDKQTQAPKPGKLGRWLAWSATALLLIALGAGVYAWRQIAPYGEIGSTYIAKQYCSCLFVTGRSETSCKAEFEPDIEKFKLSVDRSRLPEKGGVTARLSIFEGVASYDSRYGCTVGK